EADPDPAGDEPSGDWRLSRPHHRDHQPRLHQDEAERRDRAAAFQPYRNPRFRRTGGTGGTGLTLLRRPAAAIRVFLSIAKANSRQTGPLIQIKEGMAHYLYIFKDKLEMARRVAHAP